MPFSPFLSPPPPQGDGRGEQPLTRRSRIRSKQTGQFRPPQNFGAKLSRNKQRRERSDPPPGDGSASSVTAWMLARCLPVADSGIRGRSPWPKASPKGRAFSERAEHPTREAGDARRVSQDRPKTALDSPRNAGMAFGQKTLPGSPETPVRGNCGAGWAYAFWVGNLPWAWSNRRA